MLQAHARTEELWSTARQLQQEAIKRGRAADAATAVAEREAQAASSMQRLQEAKQETAAASKAVRLASEQLYVAAEARLHAWVCCDGLQGIVAEADTDLHLIWGQLGLPLQTLRHEASSAPASLH